MPADWREDLKQFLISGGTSGRKHHEVHDRLQRQAHAKAIDIELEGLLVQEKVQKFYVPTGMRGKPATIWRATIKILKRER